MYVIVLVVGLLFFIQGAFMVILRHRVARNLPGPSRSRLHSFPTQGSPRSVALFGLMCLLIGVALILFYFFTL